MSISQNRTINKKAVILDRDGTLIVDKIYLNDPEQIEYLPGVEEALKMLRDDGYSFYIATNQSGVPRGLVEIENLNEIHRRIGHHFAKHGINIEAFYYAPYMTDTNHYYRKPNPGMLLQAADEFAIDLEKSWMIGDKMTDVESGHRAKCRSILLGNDDSPSDFPEYAPPEAHCSSLLEAARFILGS